MDITSLIFVADQKLRVFHKVLDPIRRIPDCFGENQNHAPPPKGVEFCENPKNLKSWIRSTPLLKDPMDGMPVLGASWTFTAPLRVKKARETRF